jgi:DNA-binding MarR family transcriptional regulator
VPFVSSGTRAGRAESVDTAARLRLSVTRLARRLRQQADMGLSPSQLSALSTIEQHGPMLVGALAAHERIAAPTATRVVTKLQDAGLVGRTIDASDRRAVHVQITERGLSLLAESRRRKTAWLAGRIDSLGSEARRALEDALDSLDALLAEDDR